MNPQISYDPRLMKRLPDGVVTVRTAGIVVIAHNGFAAAARCRKRSPARARTMENLAETLIAAAAVILRHEEALVPMEVVNAISELTGMLARNTSQR